MSQAPRVSVITPTYNRCGRLLKVLGALERQTVGSDMFEVVLVDDGSTDGTADAVAARSFSFAWRLIRQANGGPSRARNAGIQEARGEIALFVDDDVVPEPELIAEHIASHDAEAGPLVVLGPLASLAHYDKPWVSWEQEKLEQQYTAMLRGDYEPTFRQFWTGNASVGRAALLAEGGFDTSFPRGEDVELGSRLAARGLQFRFNPRAMAFHHVDRTLDSWVHAHASYGRLELQVFERLFGEQGLEALAGNMQRLHPAIRWLVPRTTARPKVSQALRSALRSLLQSPLPRAVPRLGSHACSVLANLEYWQASRGAMGERWERLCELAGIPPS
jgi:glycosyltransferase involved in cell wall biosynthesis